MTSDTRNSLVQSSLLTSQCVTRRETRRTHRRMQGVRTTELHTRNSYFFLFFFFFFARSLSLPQKVTYFGLFFDCFKHSWKQLCLDQNCKVFSSSAGKLIFSGTCWTILLLQREIKFATVIAIPNLGIAG